MKKTWFLILFVLFSFLICSFGLTACGLLDDDLSNSSNNDPEETFYTATFYVDEEIIDTVQFTENSKDIIEPIVPEKKGYNGSWQNYQLNNEDLIIRAIYTPIEYNITYGGVPNGIENNNPVIYTVENNVILSKVNRTGYDFIGWFNGDVEVTEIAQGSSGDVSLSAKWELVEYSLIYHNVDGVDNNNPSAYTIESEDIVLLSVQKENSRFLGWYTEATFENKVEKIETNILNDINLYARFEEAPLLTLYLNETEWRTEYLTTSQISVPNETEGYFGGWADKDGIMYSSSSGELLKNVKDNISLYATSYDSIINTVADLQAVELDGKYLLGADLDLEGVEWTPIGTSSNPFVGEFNGNGKTIKNLTIGTNREYEGLFGYSKGKISSLTVKNLELKVYKAKYCGGIVGYSNEGCIDGCMLDGVIGVTQYGTSTIYVGGIVGYSKGGGIYNCSTSGDFGYALVNRPSGGQSTPGSMMVGGIVGYAEQGKLMNCFSQAYVHARGNGSGYTGYGYCGGVVGKATNMNMMYCGATGEVYCYASVTSGSTSSSSCDVGGLAGGASGTISSCYALGKVSCSASAGKGSASTYAGGLVGSSSATIMNCYATGEVSTKHSSYSTSSSQSNHAGGLVGTLTSSGSLTNCFATGNVESTGCAGGLWGGKSGNVKNCYCIGNVVNKDDDDADNFGINYGGQFDNNYIVSSQLVNGSTIPSYYEDYKVDIADIKTVDFYETTLEWSAEEWRFTVGELPILHIAVEQLYGASE